MALVLGRHKFLSVPEAAERLGVTRLTVHRWLRGTRRAPKGIRLRDVIRDTRSGQAYVRADVVDRLRRGFRDARSRRAES